MSLLDKVVILCIFIVTIGAAVADGNPGFLNGLNYYWAKDYTSMNATLVNGSKITAWSNLCIAGSCIAAWTDINSSGAGGANLSGNGAATGYIPAWSNTSNINSSIIYQTGGRIGINTTVPNASLNVNGGNIYITGSSLHGYYLYRSANLIGGINSDNNIMNLFYQNQMSFVNGSSYIAMNFDNNGRVGVNASAQTSAALFVNGTIEGTLDWTNLSSYPSACSAGYAITQLGDAVTCSAFCQSDGTNCPAAGSANVTAQNATAGSIPFMTSNSQIGNSQMSQSGNTIDVTGGLSVNTSKVCTADGTNCPSAGSSRVLLVNTTFGNANSSIRFPVASYNKYMVTAIFAGATAKDINFTVNDNSQNWLTVQTRQVNTTVTNFNSGINSTNIWYGAGSGETRYMYLQHEIMTRANMTYTRFQGIANPGITTFGYQMKDNVPVISSITYGLSNGGPFNDSSSIVIYGVNE